MFCYHICFILMFLFYFIFLFFKHTMIKPVYVFYVFFYYMFLLPYMFYFNVFIKHTIKPVSVFMLMFKRDASASATRVFYFPSFFSVLLINYCIRHDNEHWHTLSRREWTGLETHLRLEPQVCSLFTLPILTISAVSSPDGCPVIYLFSFFFKL